MGYNVEATSADCYPGTTCLINKLEIRDEKLLSEIEADITFAKATELELTPIPGQFDFEHYKAIHRYLFEDLYAWAGEVRKTDISKKGTTFVKAENIESIAQSCFERLRNKNYFKGQNFDEFIDSIVDFYCVTNMLHPFREGNGRSQRIFITQLIRFDGYDMDFSDIDSDMLMLATIQAANGVTDFLKEIFRDSIKEIDE